MAKGTVDGSTKVVFTMTQLICAIGAAVVLFGGALWAVNAFTIGGLQDDVKVIRQVAQTVQTNERDGAVRSRETEMRLAAEIANLRIELTKFSGEMSRSSDEIKSFRDTTSKFGHDVRLFAKDLIDMSTSVSRLADQMDEMQKQLVARQAALTDPKTLNAFASALKAAGIDDGKVVVVPWDSLGGNWTPPR